MRLFIFSYIYTITHLIRLPLLALSFFVTPSYAQEVFVPVEYRVGSVTHKVRAHAAMDAPVRGLIEKDSVFAVGKIVSYNDCAAGWAEVPYGVVCLMKTSVVQQEASSLPANLGVLPPTTRDDQDLHLATPSDPAFMISIYGKRDETHTGKVWASITDYETGEAYKWRLDLGKDHRFVNAHQTTKGWVLERPNGAIVPISEVYLYPASRFVGRDMQQFPHVADSLVGWVDVKEGSSIYWNQNTEEDPWLPMEYRRILDVLPVDDSSEWLQVPMGDLVGYIPKKDIKLWVDKARPSAISEEAVWVDVDLKTQMLAVRKGSDFLYITLISSAIEKDGTPLGLYQIYDKNIGWDLASLDGASDPYYMEKVPFVMHYYPRYAVHTAFWHDNFGTPASHGCINLSPKDARAVFALLLPEIPQGWEYVKQSKNNPGTILRVRNGTTEGKDKRIKP